MPLVLGGVEFDAPARARRPLRRRRDRPRADRRAARRGRARRHRLALPLGRRALRGVSSLELLSEAYEQVRAAGWRLVNADCVLVGEEPRIAPHREEMRAAAPGAIGRGRGERPRDDDRRARVHRPRRGARGAGGRAARTRARAHRLGGQRRQRTPVVPVDSAATQRRRVRAQASALRVVARVGAGGDGAQRDARDAGGTSPRRRDWRRSGS